VDNVELFVILQCVCMKWLTRLIRSSW